MTSPLSALFASERSDWRTPLRYTEAAHRTMRGIELDPATTVEANERVRADRIFTPAEDGLAQSWARPSGAPTASVFLNPPFGRDAQHQSVVAKWVQKWLTEFECGNFEQGILLVHARTGDKWFQPLFRQTLCFTRRIAFDGPDAKKQPTAGCVFVYCNQSSQAIGSFEREFSRFGYIYPAGSVIVQEVE